MVTRNARFWLSLTILLALFAMGSACGPKTETGTGTNGNETAGTAPPYVPTGKEGTITGAIAYAGAAPAPKKIDTSADPTERQRSSASS